MKYIMLIISLISLAIGAGYWQMIHAPESSDTSPAKAYGKAAIGGSFTLSDDEGNAYANHNLNGHYSLIYFGFTHCPDICPTSLMVITQALGQMGGKADNIIPIFVTLDPERDTQQVMHDYVSHFHPRMIGLTGTAEQTRQIADAYKVYYSKVPLKDSALGYTIDHSGYLYLMNKNGEYLAHFPHDISDQALVEKLTTLTHP